MNLRCGCNLPQGHYESGGWHFRPARVPPDHPFAGREGGYHTVDEAYEHCIFAQAAMARARMARMENPQRS